MIDIKRRRPRRLRPTPGVAVAVALVAERHSRQNISRAQGLPISSVDITASRSEIQTTILSLAADESVDMLVMGGYGHSRLHEGLLGGVTRAMLQTMTVPTLMTH